MKPRSVEVNVAQESAAEVRHHTQVSPGKTVASRYSRYPLVVARAVEPASTA